MFNSNKGFENQDQGKQVEKLLFSSFNKKSVLEYIKKSINSRTSRIAKSLNISIDNVLFSKNREIEEREYMKIIHGTEYLNLNWYKYIKENQPGGDPSEPRARFAYDLFNEVAENIDIKDEEGVIDYSRLKFYTTVGTEPDYHKSIDCFFEIYNVDRDGNYIKFEEILIDFTISNNKEAGKQEVILAMDSEDAVEIEYYLIYELKQNSKAKNSVYNKYIKNFSKQIVNKLKEKSLKVKENKENNEYKFEFA